MNDETRVRTSRDVKFEGSKSPGRPPKRWRNSW